MVEWKKLGEVCEVLRGKRLTKSQLSESQGYPVLHGGSTPMGFFNEYNRKANTTVVVNTGNAGSVFFYDKEFWSSDACYSLYPNKELLDKFLYLYVYGCERILKGKIRAGAMPTIDANAIKSLLIPIPSLSEQQRIVGILDTFTSAIDNLKEQIAQRRKQYEYYRDQLLDLEGKEIITTLSFGNDFQLKARIGWQGLTKKEYKTSGDYKLVTGTDFSGNLRIDFDSCVFVEKERYEQDEYIMLKVGDVLITKDGTLGKVAYIDKLDMPATLNGGVFVVRDPKKRVIPKFIMYYLTSDHFKKWMQQNHTTGSIQHLTQKLLSTFTIPVLSEIEQQRIVSILDTFEASIQNLEEQLKLLQQIIMDEMTVRQTEELADKAKGKAEREHRQTNFIPEHFKSKIKKLSQTLNTKVKVKRNVKGQGSVVIDFRDEAEFDRIMELFNQQ